jgi:hypothetical protein
VHRIWHLSCSPTTAGERSKRPASAEGDCYGHERAGNVSDFVGARGRQYPEGPQSTARNAVRFPTRPGGRSLGELAWHLAELDAYVSYGIARGDFTLSVKPPNTERPRTVESLASGYTRVHQEAVDRLRRLSPEDLDRTMLFFTRSMTIREILWER